MELRHGFVEIHQLQYVTRLKQLTLILKKEKTAIKPKLKLLENALAPKISRKEQRLFWRKEKQRLKGTSCLNMRRIIYALLFFIPFVSIGQHLAEAQNYLDRSDYKKAMAIYSQNQNKAKDTNDISLLVESQNGMADCYIDLGANYKALAVLKQNINLLKTKHSNNYALFAKTHQLLANCYDKLYLIEDYLKESNAFYSYYKKAYPNSEIYKALYYTYLGRYYNMRYLVPKAFYYTNAALKIYHKNKKEAHLIDAYLVYNAHSLT